MIDTHVLERAGVTAYGVDPATDGYAATPAAFSPANMLQPSQSIATIDCEPGLRNPSAR